MLVRDVSSEPVAGVEARFVAPSSGPSGTFQNGASSVTVPTDAAGVATAPPFTANGRAGTYEVVASAPEVSGEVLYALTNDPGPAASVTATAGTPQTARVGSDFPTRLEVRVTDAHGNGVGAASVEFAAPEVAAMLETVEAVVGFELTNAPEHAVVLTATAGTPQSARTKTDFAGSLVASARDASDAPLAGVPVTFTAPATGPSGTFAGGASSATVITGADGGATAPRLTANNDAG